MSKKRRRPQVRTISFEEQLQERLTRIPLMTEGERRQRIRQLRAHLAQHRWAHRRTLSGQVPRKYIRRGGLATPAQMQQHHLLCKAGIEAEIKALESA
jgi:uncharacterized damage-inducible protein DinB